MVKLIMQFNTVEHLDGGDDMTVYLDVQKEAPTTLEMETALHVKTFMLAAMEIARHQIMDPDEVHTYATGKSAEALAKARGVIPS